MNCTIHGFCYSAPLSRNGQADDELGPAWHGVYLYRTVMLALNDPHHHVETQTRALADPFRGKERIEDASFNIFRDAGTVVDDRDTGELVVFPGVDDQFSFALGFHGIYRIVDEVGPDLVELANEGHDPGQRGIVFFYDLYIGLLELVLHHRQGALDTRVNVDELLALTLIHMRKVLDALDQ